MSPIVYLSAGLILVTFGLACLAVARISPVGSRVGDVCFLLGLVCLIAGLMDVLAHAILAASWPWPPASQTPRRLASP